MSMSPRLLRPRATGFNPKSISGLKLWLDATDSTTITLNGSSVSEWRDKSGNAFHFSQSTSNNQPSYTGTINGKSAIAFDGTNDGLDRLTADHATVADATGACAFVVYEISGTDTQYSALKTSTSGSGHDRFSTANYHAYFRTSRFAALANPAPQSGRVILTSSVNASADLQSFRINGSLYQSSACATTFAAWRALTSQFWAVGYDGSYLTGSVGEVILFGRSVIASEISLVEKYLSAKWGVTLV